MGNIVYSTEDFSNANWTKSSSFVDVNTTKIQTPFNTIAGEQVNFNSGDSFISQSVTVTALAGYTISLYFKDSSAILGIKVIQDSITEAFVRVDTSTSVTSTSSPAVTVTEELNGWKRLSFNYTTKAALSSMIISIGSYENLSTGGDTTSNSSIIIYGINCDRSTVSKTYYANHTVAGKYIRALNSGNFSNPATWSTGTVPVAGQLACCGNFKVTVDIADIRCHLDCTRTSFVAAGGTSYSFSSASYGFVFQASDTVTRNMSGWMIATGAFGSTGYANVANFNFNAPFFFNLWGDVVLSTEASSASKSTSIFSLNANLATPTYGEFNLKDVYGVKEITSSSYFYDIFSYYFSVSDGHEISVTLDNIFPVTTESGYLAAMKRDVVTRSTAPVSSSLARLTINKKTFIYYSSSNIQYDIANSGNFILTYKSPSPFLCHPTDYDSSSYNMFSTGSLSYSKVIFENGADINLVTSHTYSTQVWSPYRLNPTEVICYGNMTFSGVKSGGISISSSYLTVTGNVVKDSTTLNAANYVPIFNITSTTVEYTVEGNFIVNGSLNPYREQTYPLDYNTSTYKTHSYNTSSAPCIIRPTTSQTEDSFIKIKGDLILKNFCAPLYRNYGTNGPKFIIEGDIVTNELLFGSTIIEAGILYYVNSVAGKCYLEVLGDVYLPASSTQSHRNALVFLSSQSTMRKIKVVGKIYQNTTFPFIYDESQMLAGFSNPSIEVNEIVYSGARPSYVSAIYSLLNTVLINKSTDTTTGTGFVFGPASAMQFNKSGNTPQVLGKDHTGSPLLLQETSYNNPVSSDVRYGVSFGNGLTGSLRVPDPATVLNGILTDNTTGTLVIDAGSGVGDYTARFNSIDADLIELKNRQRVILSEVEDIS